jgi:GH25 family lysozyme M1 (1,4-beta-N-acetylmuramidase)
MSKGIDVSAAQGVIDWSLVKEGVDFAIIRMGFGSNIESQDDKQALRNVEECTKYGIPYGLYLYSYALNKEQCLSEVEHMIRFYNSIPDKSHLKLGLWFDMEDADDYKGNHMGKTWNNFVDLWCEFCNTWVDEVKAKTGESIVGVYASLGALKSFLDGIREDIPKWVAAWGAGGVTFPNMYMWQYSSDGEVNGIGGRVDMDECYINIPTPAPTPEPTPEPTPTTGHSVGEVVSFNAIYVSSTSTEALPPLVTSGTITDVIPGTHNPDLINGGTGWVNDSCIVGSATPQPAQSVSVGASIMIKDGATDLNTGTGYASWVYETVYTVKEVNGDRVVFGNETGITGATDISNVYLV